MQLKLQSTKVIAINVIVTFFQAALASLVLVDGLDKAALAGAVGAGLSAVWNGFVKPAIKGNTALYK